MSRSVVVACGVVLVVVTLGAAQVERRVPVGVTPQRPATVEPHLVIPPCAFTHACELCEQIRKVHGRHDSNWTIGAPVFLPEGAEVTALEVQFEAGVPAKDAEQLARIRVALRRRGLDAASRPETVAEVTSERRAGSSAVTSSTVEHGRIDGAHMYYLEAQPVPFEIWKGKTGIGVVSLSGVRIAYTRPEPSGG